MPSPWQGSPQASGCGPASLASQPDFAFSPQNTPAPLAHLIIASFHMDSKLQDQEKNHLFSATLFLFLIQVYPQPLQS